MDFIDLMREIDYSFFANINLILHYHLDIIKYLLMLPNYIFKGHFLSSHV
jgi:hypothetical protein